MSNLAPLALLGLMIGAAAAWSLLSPRKPIPLLAICPKCGQHRYGWTRWFPIHPRCPLCGKR